jgi:hypothetical protein
MTNTKLSQLVAEAVCLDRSIRDQTERLKELKAALATEADSRADDATPTDGGGTSITFEGADGCYARVTTNGATLKSSIKAEGKDIEKVKAAAGLHFNRLFETVLAYSPVEGFRDQAASLLGRDAGKLLKLCSSPGRTSVSFETKESAAAVAAD